MMQLAARQQVKLQIASLTAALANLDESVQAGF